MFDREECLETGLAQHTFDSNCVVQKKVPVDFFPLLALSKLDLHMLMCLRCF